MEIFQSYFDQITRCQRSHVRSACREIVKMILPLIGFESTRRQIARTNPIPFHRSDSFFSFFFFIRMVEKDGSAYECIDVKSVGKNGHEKHLNLTRFRFETVTISKDGIENISRICFIFLRNYSLRKFVFFSMKRERMVFVSN